jgi:hypothetical protein
MTSDLTRPTSTLVAIANGGTDLVKGTDYTVEVGVVTIEKAYLAAQPTGTTKLVFRFRGDYRDDVHSTTADGAAIEFTFQGTAVDWVTAPAPDQGEAEIYIDSELVGRVNLFGEARVTTRQTFTQAGMKDGEHTLRIVKVSGEVLRNDMIRYTVAKKP